MPAPTPENESERLAALRDLQVLDTPPARALDQTVRLIADVLEVPIALVSLVDHDRQWFKAAHGLDASQTPRDQAFCAHTILEDRDFVVHDTLDDPRFRQNPLVTGEPHIRFYVGVPLTLSSGHRIGTLCAIDREPHAEVDPRLIQLMRHQADLVVSHLELRRANRELTRANAALQENNELLRAFGHALSHDVRVPLRHLRYLLQELAPFVAEGGVEAAVLAEESVHRLDRLVTGLNAYVRAGHEPKAHPIDIDQLARHCAADVLLDAELPDARIDIEPLPPVIGDAAHLERVLTNLLDNAVRYHGERPVDVRVSGSADRTTVRIEVLDHGIGIAAKHLDRVFEPLLRLQSVSTPGSGLGLASCKTAIEAMGGRMGVQSELGTGSTFWFELPGALGGGRP